MRHAALLVLAVLGLATGSACSQSAREPAPADLSSRQTRVPGEYLVTLADGADIGAVTELYGRFGIKGTREIARNLYLVTLAEDPGPAALEQLRSAHIKTIQPNLVYRAQVRGKAQ